MWVNVVLLYLSYVVCGIVNSTNVSQVGTRIVGGTIVSINNFPYQVSVQLGTSHLCGGALIQQNLVLSAAHCFSYSSMPEIYRVRLGSNQTSSGGQFLRVQKITVHENYSSLDNDIAILELAQNVTVSNIVQAINISTSDDYTTGSLATVSGWGHEQENGTISTYLRSVDVPLTTRKSCSVSYKGLATITSNMICAGYSTGGKDACQGDSGGPLVQNGNLIGVVSFGMGCAREYPGVYTNVARYIDWISKNSNYTVTVSGSTKCDSIWCIFSGSQSTTLNSWLLVGSVIGTSMYNLIFGSS